MCLESSTFWTSCSPHTLTKSKQGLSWTECRALMHRLTDFKQRVFANTSNSALAFMSSRHSCLDCDQNSAPYHFNILQTGRTSKLQTLSNEHYCFAGFPNWNVYILLCTYRKLCIYWKTLHFGLFKMYVQYKCKYLVTENLIAKVEPHYRMLKSTWNQDSSCSLS